MKLVFLLEERSMKIVLDSILPRILPNDIDFITIPHEGKGDLRKSIPNKLRGWNEPDVKFVIVHDQDANDCIELKAELREVCRKAGKDCLIRIVCRELEAWYWGDIKAIENAYNINLDRIKNKRKYAVPDAIVNPKRELMSLVHNHQQILGAKRISKYMDIDSNKSKSFQVFVSGVRNLCGCNIR